MRISINSLNEIVEEKIMKLQIITVVVFILILVGGISVADELPSRMSSSATPETIAMLGGDDFPVEEYGGTVDVDEASLEMIDGELFLNISGSLPNPCYTLRYEVTEFAGDYSVDVYSMVNLKMMCAQVIISFYEVIGLGSTKPGASVYVNGGFVGISP
jgi:hypothetical protein